MSDIFQIINWVALGIFLVFGAVGFIRGFFKGTIRSVVDIVFLLINTLVSVLIAKGLASALVSPETVYDILYTVNGGATEGTLAGIVEQMETYLHEGRFFETADLSLLYAIFETVLTPVIFVPVFLLMGIVFKAIKAVFVRIFIPKVGKKSEKSGKKSKRKSHLGTRMGGAALGAVKNFMFWVILLAPIVSFATFGIGAVNRAKAETNPEGVIVYDPELVTLEQSVNSGALSMIDSCGGWFFEILASTSVGDISVSLVNEANNAINIYKAIDPLTKMDSTNFTEKETAMVDVAINEIEKSRYLTSLTASLLSQASKEMIENDSFFMYKVPKLGPSFDPVVDKTLEIMSTTDSVGLVGDLRTFSDVFKSTVNHGLYRELNSEEGDLYLVLENGDFYTDILVRLHENLRTRPVVPTLANAMQDYLYEIYEEVNGEPYGTGKGEPVNEDAINNDSLNDEGQRIATAIQQIRAFSDSTAEYEYVDEIVKNGDFVALGTSLNQVRDSIFFCNSYRFLLNSLLHSESCAKLGIFDSNFVENATRPGADMVALLVSRQNLATLTMAMWDGNSEEQENSLKVIIANLSATESADKNAAQAEANALKELAALDNLDRYGVRGDKGNTVSTITESLVDTIHSHNYTDKNGDGVVDQTDIDMEAADAAHVLTILSNSHNSGAANVFDMGDGESRTGETVDRLIDGILNSTIATEMIDTAVHTNGQDPYGISMSLSDADRSSLEGALSARMQEGNGANNTAYENIAAVFGVNLIP